jgi:hexosaminidase
MAFNKFNKLHLHATDSQSWPLEIPSLPDLARRGAYYPGLSYSPADLSDIQRYGALQGVEVFLEVDVPGHTASIWHGYPELIASYNILPEWSGFAGEPPSGTLKLNSSKVDDFMATLLDDLLPRVAPYNSYFHTGGDEVNFGAYKNDETINATNAFELRPYIQAFIDKLHRKVIGFSYYGQNLRYI